MNGYLDWMLVDSPVPDELDPGQEDGDDVKDGEEEKEVEQRVPPTTVTLEGHMCQWSRRNPQVMLPYVRGISEQLRKDFKSFDMPAYFKLTNTLWQLLVWPKDKVEKWKLVGPVYVITCDK